MADTAGAVVTFLQVGLSLATTLYTYIADVKDAPSCVASLAAEIEATLLHLEELDKLLKRTDRTTGWNQNGIKLAEKCRADSEKVINDIVRLLRRSNSTFPAGHLINREDIDISVFNQSVWPVFKPQVEVVQRQLARTKIDILLARSVYDATAGRSIQERKNASDRIVGLTRGQLLARQQLKRAKQAQRAMESASHIRFEEPPGRGRDERRVQDTPRQPSEAGSGNDSDTDEELFTREQLRQAEEAARAKIKTDELEARERLDELDKLQATAVETYKAQLLVDIDTAKKRTQDAKKRLTQAFDPPPSQAQLARYIEQEEALNLSGEMKTLIDALASNSSQHLIPPVHKDLESLPSPQHKGFLRRILGKPRLPRRSDPVESNFLPEVLQRNDSSNEIPRLISITLSFNGVEWTTMPIHVPLPWLITRLKAEEKESKSKKRISQSIETFANLPYSCRLAADQWLRSATGDRASWVLIFAHYAETSAARTRGMLHRSIAGETAGKHLNSIVLIFRAAQYSSDQIDTSSDINAVVESKIGGTDDTGSKFQLDKLGKTQEETVEPSSTGGGNYPNPFQPVMPFHPTQLGGPPSYPFGPSTGFGLSQPLHFPPTGYPPYAYPLTPEFSTIPGTSNQYGYPVQGGFPPSNYHYSHPPSFQPYLGSYHPSVPNSEDPFNAQPSRRSYNADPFLSNGFKDANLGFEDYIVERNEFAPPRTYVPRASNYNYDYDVPGSNLFDDYPRGRQIRPSKRETSDVNRVKIKPSTSERSRAFREESPYPSRKAGRPRSTKEGVTTRSSRRKSDNKHGYLVVNPAKSKAPSESTKTVDFEVPPTAFEERASRRQHGKIVSGGDLSLGDAPNRTMFGGLKSPPVDFSSDSDVELSLDAKTLSDSELRMRTIERYGSEAGGTRSQADEGSRSDLQGIRSASGIPSPPESHHALVPGPATVEDDDD